MLQNKLKQLELIVRTDLASCHEIFRVGVVVVVVVVVVVAVVVAVAVAVAVVVVVVMEMCEFSTCIFRVL
jgi:hypothetical protein